MTTHTDYADLALIDRPDGTRTARVKLDTYDTAWMPGSTKRLYHGPLEVSYVEYPDGGIDVISYPRNDLGGESYPTT